MKTKQTIKRLLAKNKEDGMTITELHQTSGLSRSAIRDALAELRGSQEVEYRKVQMAKVYKIKKEEKLI